jgi:hypothetical protein
MAAIRERWYADGWEFTEGDIRDVEYRSGQLISPAKRGGNATVSNRTGEVWRPKKHGPGSFTLEVWLGTYQREAQQLWDELLRAVDSPHRLVTWRRITANGETRTCEGEVTGALEPTAIAQNGYRASIEVNVPAGYWRGDQLVTVASPTDGAAGVREFDLAAFATSTAPLDSLTVRLAGHLVNPRVADITPLGRGDSLTYAGTIPAGKGLTLANGDWTDTPDAGWDYNPAALNYTGDRFLQLAATPPGGVQRLRLTADTIGAGAGVTVSGYRSYLC